MLKQKILEDLKKTAEELGYQTSDIVCTIPQNPSFGDYTTNMALQLAKQNTREPRHSPLEIAKVILEKFGKPDYLEKVEVAGSGFINFFIRDEVLLEGLSDISQIKKTVLPKKILVEFGHANLLKEAHIGHLRTYILGESIARTLESLGNEVFRANYQGDVGLHVAKALWGINKLGLPEKELSLAERVKFLGRAYVLGSSDYDTDPEAKEKIDGMNTAIYLKDPDIMGIYETSRGWSLQYYEELYKLLDIKYDCLFFESELYIPGKKIVLENTGPLRPRSEASTIFEKSEGAVIFPGEKYGLHNRVFITSAGNTTYEGKEMGLAQAEYKAFPYDSAVHVVGSEQAGYFQVVIKAIELLFKHLLGKKYHLSYGMVDLKAGKMSSRTGNIVSIDDLVKIVTEKVSDRKIALGAIKFAYLKFSPSSNMIFNIEQSVSLEGDSGPYLQYTYARIKSVLSKAGASGKPESVELDTSERAILRQLMYFQETVEQVADTYHPNLLASYLVDLARIYNLFYQSNRVIGSGKQEFRLKLSSEVALVLQKGLYLLGIEAPERM